MLVLESVPLHLLGCIAQNIGWEKKDYEAAPRNLDEIPEEYRKRIQEMSPMEALECWSSWTLGDGSWARTFMDHWMRLSEANLRILPIPEATFTVGEMFNLTNGPSFK